MLPGASIGEFFRLKKLEYENIFKQYRNQPEAYSDFDLRIVGYNSVIEFKHNLK